MRFPDLKSLITLTLMLGSVRVHADAYEDGQSAFRQGNYGRAIDVWMRAANENDAKSQFRLGLCYALGTGVPKNDIEAVRWYRRAAEQGLAAAQNNLGLMYTLGRGVRMDESEAAKWYKRAARQGSLEGLASLARSYEDGRGVPRNYNIAAMTYLQAAKRGYAPAQANLGLLYAAGVPGVPHDYALAYKWLSLGIPRLSAVDQEQFIERRNEVVLHLAPEERDRLDRAVREWKPIISGN